MFSETAVISSDIDTLATIYKGHGCRRVLGYTYAELEMGLEAFVRFLEPYRARATCFMVGTDFDVQRNHDPIRALARGGHEIANHSMHHRQGFRLLSPEEKAAEISGMAERCVAVTGVSPRGFRSPGWNISDDALPVLRRLGYVYDASVFPTSLAPLMKLAHWRAMSSRSRADRTTMGQATYALAPIEPYLTAADRLGRTGDGGVVEIPVRVTPHLRLPFIATFLLATGWTVFKRSYAALQRKGAAIHLQFHLSDFVDYAHPALADQVPTAGDGVYVPQALRMPLRQKLEIFRRAVDLIAGDRRFVTMLEWAEAVAARARGAR
jgi:peptidoglycan-N-acetylglucosamine deacetylase